MGTKGINHFVFFPDKRASWRERFVRRTETELASLQKTCTSKAIDLVCGIILDPALNFMSSDDLNLLVAKISFLVKLGISHFALFFNQSMPSGDGQNDAEFAVEQVII